MSIIKEERKLVKELENGDAPYAKLPVFAKLKDGAWAFTGETVEIHTIAEYEQYKTIYAELLDFIQQNFSSNIAGVYKKALNSLVTYKGQSKVSDLMTTLSKGKTVTLGKVFASANSENDVDAVASLRHIVSGVNLASGKSQKAFKPFRLDGKGSEYIFPEFTDKGVAVKVENKALSVKFRAVDEAEAMRLKEYMLSSVPGTTKEELILKRVVKEYFDYSKQVADLVKSGKADPAEIYEGFSRLNEMSGLLFDTDLSYYEKKVPVNQEEDFESGLDEFDSEVFDGEEFDADEFDDFVAAIDFKAPYKTEPVFTEAGPVIRISPVDGSFQVKFDPKTKTYSVEKAEAKGPVNE